MELAKALEIRRGVTAIIGSGGKTTLMLTLARELSAAARVIVTTTTHIYPPSGMRCLMQPSAAEIAEALAEHPCVAVGSPAREGKLAAAEIPMAVLAELADYVLAEADGSRQLPLKAHAAHEPVIPENSRRVICVVGASGFGKPVRETVHRWERFCGLTGAAETEPVTPELAAKALLAEGRCDTMLLNQIDGADRRPAAERFAAELAGHGLRVWGGSLRLGCIFPL